MKKHAIALFIVLLSDVALAEQYFCKAEKSSGFAFNNSSGIWTPVIIQTSNQYLIKPGKGKKYKYYVFPLRSGTEDILNATGCKEGFSKAGVLICDVGLGGTYIFNRNNSRIMRSFMLGYWNVDLPFGGPTDKSSNTPFMEIGSCELQKGK